MRVADWLRNRLEALTLAHVALLVPWVAVVVDAWTPIVDSSFLWHVRAGDLQLEAGAVLVEDPFSFTMLGEAWRTQSWLVEVFYGWAEKVAGGLGFVPLMLLIVGSLIMVAVGVIGYRSSRSVSATAAMLILTTILIVSFLSPRPVVFSYLLLALTVLAWDTRRLRWTTPFLFWIWAGVHASFLIGLGYVGLRLLMQKEWRWLPTAAVCGLVTLGTAHGLGTLSFLLDFFESREALTYISEWKRPEFFSAYFPPFITGIVVVLLGAIRQRITPIHLWIIVPFFLLGISSIRAVPTAWIALLPLVGLALGPVKLGQTRSLPTPMLVTFLAFVLVLPFLIREDGGLEASRFPVQARAAMNSVKTFHDDRSGGYLIWAEWPARLVYFDDRAELYGERMGEFVRLRNGDQDWRPVFERDGIEQALLNPEDELTASLRGEGWVTVYEDDGFVLLRPS